MAHGTWLNGFWLCDLVLAELGHFELQLSFVLFKDGHFGLRITQVVDETIVFLLETAQFELELVDPGLVLLQLPQVHVQLHRVHSLHLLNRSLLRCGRSLLDLHGVSHGAVHADF